jgi:hypothetical protein
MTGGGLHGPFYDTGHMSILPLPGLGKGPPQKPWCQYLEAIFKPLQHEQAVSGTGNRKGRPLPVNNR